MPTYRITHPETGQVIKMTGDSPPTEADIIAAFDSVGTKPVAEPPQSVVEPASSEGSSVLDNIIGGAEVAANVISSTGAEVAGGLVGIGAGIMTGDVDASVDALESTRDALTYQPKTQAGQNQLQAIGEFVAPVGEAIEAVNKASGDAAFNATGSPEAGALATAAPEAALASIPVVGQLLRKTKNKVLQHRRADIGQKIDAGSTDNDTALYIRDGAGDVQKDKLATEASRQGFDEGVLAAIKGSDTSDISAMLAMVNRLDKGKKNARFAAENRPADVAGAAFAKRIVSVKRVNQRAGRQLDVEANKLKGKPVDVSEPVETFIASLDDQLGVQFDNGKLKFQGSDIEGVRGAQVVLKQVVKRMLETDVPDAYDVHRLKRFIDEQVTYGKNQRGLSGKAEIVIKELRANLDGLLDSQFDDYRLVNETYSETISALNSFQDAVGQKTNLFGENADKTIGRLSRRVLSNVQSRERLLDAMDSINGVAKKHGVKVDGDLITQAMFLDELDRIFGAAAKTSLQGEMDKALARNAARGSLKDAAVDAAVDGVDKLRGVNQDAAIESIRKLLREELKRRRKGTATTSPGTALQPHQARPPAPQ